MRTNLWIGAAVLAASALAGPVAVAQTTTTTTNTHRVAVSSNASYLGIGVQDVDGERAKALKLKEVRGAEITKVYEDSPAAKAGIKEGDVILEYNGQSVEGHEQLSRLVRETPVGRQVKIGVWRNGASQTLTATVEAGRSLVIDGGAWVMPEIRIPPMPKMDIPRVLTVYQNPALGIYGEALGEKEQLADFFGVKDGVLVTEVFKNSAAEKAGIKAGDVIVKVEDTKVSTSRDITNTLRASRSKKTVNVTVVRNKKEMQLPVTLEASNNIPGVRAGYLVGKPARVINAPAYRRLKLTPGDRVI